MKRAYMKPTVSVVEIRQHSIICTSDWDVINPGQPNYPVSAMPPEAPLPYIEFEDLGEE